MKFLTIICAFIFSWNVHVIAQNSFGALHSNYTPTNSLYINPSSILDAKVWLDINIVGAGSYLNNDLVFLKDQKLSRVTIDLIKEESTLTDDDVGYNQSRKKYHAYNRNFIAGPSAVWSQGDHAVGLSTGARSYTAARKIPDFVAQFIENGVPDFSTQHDINYSVNNLRVASVHFAEIKLTYAHTFLKKRRNLFMGGISISKFFSMAGGAANVYNFNFLVDNDSLSEVFRLKADAMMAPSSLFSNSSDFTLYPKGGMGLDLGFTYQKMLGEASYYYPNSPKMGCRQLGYKYKLGLSIIDIGSVKFEPENTLYSGYEFDDYSWYYYADEEVNEENPTDLYAPQEADIANGVVRKKNKISLPTFFSVQYDYNLWASRLYINGTIIQGVMPGKRTFGQRHANSISITPRFETYFFDFALPFSLYEYQHPQLGASLRLGPITIGTDKIINWLFTKDIYGMDIYFYLKLPLQYHPKCKSRLKGAKSRFKDNSPTKCTI